MPGIGTLANCVAIIIGALLGVFCKRGLPEKWQETMMSSIALCILIIGVQMALKTQNIIIVKPQGYCGGVLKAIETAKKTRIQYHPSMLRDLLLINGF